MEFNYFLNQLPIDSDDIIFTSLYPGLDFTSNVSEPYIGETLESSSSLESFTIILTFTRNLPGAKILFSSNAGEVGWRLGITTSNFLFFEKTQNTVESFIFNDINLGKKNCIAITKNYNSISIYKYDLISRNIESLQSFFFTDALSPANEITICGALGDFTDYVLPFDGEIDQIALFSEPYEASYLLGLFSGFLPYTLSSSTSNSFTLIDSNSNFVGSNIENDNDFLYSFTTGLNDYIVDNLTTGEYVVNINGDIYSTIDVDSYIYTGVNLCEGSGLHSNFNYFSTTELPTGAYLGSQAIEGLARIVYSDTSIYIGYDLSFTGSYFNNSSAYYNYYYTYTSTTGDSLLYDNSYETGFLLNGVTTEFADLIILATGSGAVPSGYNQVSYLDNVVNKFYVPGLSSERTIYYNGYKLEGNDYVYTDNFVDISNTDESIGDYLIYDNSSNTNLLYMSLDNFATGDFYPNASIVFTGDYSYTGIKRELRANYLETSEYHMYHACKIQKPGDYLLFNL